MCSMLAMPYVLQEEIWSIDQLQNQYTTFCTIHKTLHSKTYLTLTEATSINRILRLHGITMASTKNMKETPKPQLLWNVTPCVLVYREIQ
jgi:hypothetical protein